MGKKRDNVEFIEMDGILREKAIYSQNQVQTKDCFSYKWKAIDSYSGKEMNNTYRSWLLEKYGLADEKRLNKIFFKGCTMIDAGCGAGMAAIDMLQEKLKDILYIGVDISDSVNIAKEHFEKAGYGDKCKFIQCDLNHIPVKEGEEVDVIFSEGVLHHTDSTEQAIYNLTSLLKPGGYFCFYVYARKAPIREFTDDYIRKYFSEKTDEETWEELRPLTKLGKALGELNITIDVPEDIPYLGIKAGKIDLQRLIYWNIFKCYYRPEWTIEEMNHVNFDWYRPANCHRQTPEQVEKWCQKANLIIEHMGVEDAGITVVARKAR